MCNSRANVLRVLQNPWLLAHPPWHHRKWKIEKRQWPCSQYIPIQSANQVNESVEIYTERSSTVANTET